MNHHRVGTGEPLVLIHGVGSRWQVWEPIIETLSEVYEVIAIDLPGFGESEPLPHTTVDTLTDAVHAFIDQLDLERPHIAGNSMGGLIALNLGARGLARTVTAYSPIGFWNEAGRIWCQRSLGNSKVLGQRIAPQLPAILGTVAGRTLLSSLVFGKPWAIEPRVAVDTVHGVLRATAFEEALKSFDEAKLADGGRLGRIPVTIAWGSRDVLLTYRTQSRRARQWLPEARHITLSGSGHIPFYDDPDGSAKVLLDRISR
ncbi:MAG: alpha/beta hydrolase [Nocardia sp.]|nr:alpha/beta hydrolase [Nocardia sp.]